MLELQYENFSKLHNTILDRLLDLFVTIQNDKLATLKDRLLVENYELSQLYDTNMKLVLGLPGAKVDYNTIQLISTNSIVLPEYKLAISVDIGSDVDEVIGKFKIHLLELLKDTSLVINLRSIKIFYNCVEDDKIGLIISFVFRKV